MRRALLLTGLLLLAGCGEAEEAAAPRALDPKLTTPGHGIMPRGEPARVRNGLPAGETGVLGLDGRAGVRPERLAIAEDAELERIEWTRWDEDGASGRGRLALLECDPDCGSGRTRLVRATVELSDPVLCAEDRFYDRASVTIEDRPADAGGVRGEELPQPASFIQAPC